MINLIPDNLRINNRYALRSSQLLRYTSVAALTMFCIVVVTGISILGMQHTQNNLQKQIDNQNRNLSAYKALQTQAEQLSSELTTVNSLLSQQVAFSTLLPQIAKIMPPGAVLTDLNVSTSDLLPASAAGSAAKGTTSASSSVIQKPFVIQAAVLNRDVASTLLANIKATTNLFTDADIVSVNQSTVGTNDANSKPSVAARYPYQVTINAYLKKINPNTTAKSGATK